MRVLLSFCAVMLLCEPLLGDPLIPQQLRNRHWYYHDVGGPNASCRYRQANVDPAQPAQVGMENFVENFGSRHSCALEPFVCRWDDNFCESEKHSLQLCENGNVRVYSSRDREMQIWAATSGIGIVTDMHVGECNPLKDRFVTVSGFRIVDASGSIAKWLEVGQAYGIQFDGHNEREKSAISELQAELSVIAKGQVLASMVGNLGEIAAQGVINSLPDWSVVVPDLEPATAVVFRLKFHDNKNHAVKFDFPYSVGRTKTSELRRVFERYQKLHNWFPIEQTLQIENNSVPPLHTVFAIDLQVALGVSNNDDHGNLYLPCFGFFRSVTMLTPSGWKIPMGHGNGCERNSGTLTKTLDVKTLEPAGGWRLMTDFAANYAAGGWDYWVSIGGTVTYRYFVPE